METWAIYITAFAALLAIIISVWSTLIARRALTIAQNQEKRSLPSMTLYLANGYYLISKENDRVYAFNLSFTNSSGSDNSIVHLDLNIQYKTSEEIPIKIKIPVDSEASRFFKQNSNTIVVPYKLDAYQTIAGWCYFIVRYKMIQQMKIDGYEIAVTDANGKVNTINCTTVIQLVEKNDVQ